MTDDLSDEERELRKQGLATGNPNLLGSYQQFLRNQREANDKKDTE